MHFFIQDWRLPLASAANVRRAAVRLLALPVALSLWACSNQQAPVESRQGLLEKKKPSDQVTLPEEATRLANIKSFVVGRAQLASETRTTGEIKADENRIFHINSLVAGRVVADKVFLGDLIEQGQTMALIQNLEVVKAHADFIHQYHENEIEIRKAQTRCTLTQKNLERIRQLNSEGIIAQKDLIQAQADAAIAESNLAGFKEHSVHLKEEASAVLSAYGARLGDVMSHKLETTSPLKSPRGGVVIGKTITVGDIVTSEQPLYTVADLSKVWLNIAIYDKDLSALKEGESVEFITDSLPGRKFIGTISYIQPSAGDTRTFLARAILDNQKLLLKPGMFGQIKIRNMQGAQKPFLPEAAIQSNGGEKFVFLDLGGGQYRKRVVVTGEPVEGGYLVNAGIKCGDRVVGQGSFKLKAEMLKGNLGEE